VPWAAAAQEPDKVAALKQSLAANAKLLKQYKWVETTVISMKGEEKSRVQKQCFYGPDGKIQKQQLTAPPEPAVAPGGMKGKIAAKKKAEITAKMKDAAALVQSYVPPDPQRIQAVKTAGNSRSADGPEFDAAGSSRLREERRTSASADTARNALQTVERKIHSHREGRRHAGRDLRRFATGLYPGNVVLERAGREDPGGGQNSELPACARRPSRVGGSQTGAAAAKPAGRRVAHSRPSTT
jgi:hypothetical protein